MPSWLNPKNNLIVTYPSACPLLTLSDVFISAKPLCQIGIKNSHSEYKSKIPRATQGPKQWCDTELNMELGSLGDTGSTDPPKGLVFRMPGGGYLGLMQVQILPVVFVDRDGWVPDS